MSCCCVRWAGLQGAPPGPLLQPPPCATRVPWATTTSSRNAGAGIARLRTRAGATLASSNAVAQEPGTPSGTSKVVVVGAGWAGLAAAHHLSNQVCTTHSPPTALPRAHSLTTQQCSLRMSSGSHSLVNACLNSCNWQGLDVTLVEAGPQPGGLVAGWKTDSGRSVEVGIHGAARVPGLSTPTTCSQFELDLLESAVAHVAILACLLARSLARFLPK